MSVAEVYVRMKIEKRRTEVLVVGSGAAGLRAALEARSRLSLIHISEPTRPY